MRAHAIESSFSSKFHPHPSHCKSFPWCPICIPIKIGNKHYNLYSMSVFIGRLPNEHSQSNVVDFFKIGTFGKEMFPPESKKETKPFTSTRRPLTASFSAFHLFLSPFLYILQALSLIIVIVSRTQIEARVGGCVCFVGTMAAIAMQTGPYLLFINRMGAVCSPPL